MIVSAHGNQVAEAVVLAGSSGGQSDTQQQGLLNNQYQYGRNQEAGETVLRIEDGNVFILNGGSAYFVLAVGSVVGSLYLYLLVHHERGIGIGGQHGLVVQHSTHVAV